MKKLNQVLITLLLLLALTGAAYATVGQNAAMLDYADIKITLNGVEIIPQDANGNAVEPFAISGTTYLPVRAVANALGLDVDWDQATKTVILKTQNSNQPDSSVPIMDHGGVQVLFTGFSAPDNAYTLGKYIDLKIVNSSGQDVTIQVRDLSVNGMMVNSVFSSKIAAGKTAIDKIWVMQNSLDAAGIKEIESAEFKLVVIDNNMETIYKSDAITVPN